jgi:hypothetical protein
VGREVSLVRGIEGPPCPMSHGFGKGIQAELHREKVRFIDTLYKALKPWTNEDGEFTNEDISSIYTKVNSELNDYMRLYKTTSAPQDMYHDYVESFWYQCMTCGFILSANREPRRPR